MVIQPKNHLSCSQEIIEISSKPGDVVFDPFCGSATTLVAASKLDRNWVGIDILEKVLDLFQLRMENEKSHISRDEFVRRDFPKRTDLK